MQTKHQRHFDASETVVREVARRDNLRDTIAALEQRLATIKVPMVEAVAA
jgi:hypothetical protein